MSDSVRDASPGVQAHVYFLLSRLWISEVDESLAEQLSNDPLKSAWRDICGVSVPDGQLDLDSLATEYCAVFVGPSGHLPPVQSVWTEGHFRGDCEVSMKRYLDLLTNFEPPDRVEPDHLGVQLSVMGTILAQLETVDDAETSDSISQLANAFFRDHLSWTAPLTAAVRSRADSSFYAALGHVTEDLLQ